MQNLISLQTITEKIRNFDAYPKTLEDFRIKTYSGATVTVISGLLMIVLFISELNYYLTPEVREELLVDVSRSDKLRINADIVFPHISCPCICAVNVTFSVNTLLIFVFLCFSFIVLSIDAIDISGEQHINIEHNIYKRRLNLKGEPIEKPEKETSLGNTEKVSEEFLNKISEKPALDPNRCESCYGAETNKRKCCNTCDDVRQAYNEKGWGLTSLDEIIQCKREGMSEQLKNFDREGCQIFGYLEVNRVAGNFHIAPGKSFSKHRVHVHDLNPHESQQFNITHRIRHLSFGRNIAGKTNPLDGTVQIAEQGSMMFQYYVKIVPTLYSKTDGQILQTNQFAVTRHSKALQDTLSENGLPGVFFIYEFAPIMVKYSETHKSFMHFLTSVCAIIGGIFTVAGIIDSMIYHSVRAIQKKIELGKLS